MTELRARLLLAYDRAWQRLHDEDEICEKSPPGMDARGCQRRWNHHGTHVHRRTLRTETDVKRTVVITWRAWEPT